jgi:hypothetical protein
MYIQEILHGVFEINSILRRVLWWGLANMDDTLLHSEFRDQGPQHIFLTNYKTPYLIGILAVELKTTGQPDSRKRTGSALYTHILQCVAFL